MFGGRVKRIVAVGTAAVALAGGAVLGMAGAASADPHHGQGDPDHHKHCHMVQGQWVRTWHPATRDRHGKCHPGYWTRTWVPAHKVCNR